MTSKLQEQAKRRMRQIRRRRAAPRFRRALGTLVSAGLLDAPGQEIEESAGPVDLADVLWAGTVEPRMLELLPAVLLKRPGLVSGSEDLPDDLREVLHAIRHQRPAPPLRGVESESYLKWVERVGRRGRRPSLAKSFRFRAEDVERLEGLRAQLPGTSDTDIVRTALRALATSLRGEAS